MIAQGTFGKHWKSSNCNILAVVVLPAASIDTSKKLVHCELALASPAAPEHPPARPPTATAHLQEGTSVRRCEYLCGLRRQFSSWHAPILRRQSTAEMHVRPSSDYANWIRLSPARNRITTPRPVDLRGEPCCGGYVRVPVLPGQRPRGPAANASAGAGGDGQCVV